jgi:hypothetical protein
MFMGAFSEDQHMQAVTDQTQGDKPGLSVVEAIILALNRGVPIEPFRSLQGHAMFGRIRCIFGRIELDFHKDFRTPIKLRLQ